VIHHVALETPRAQAEAEVAFWALLGFREVVAPPALRERARWVERAGTQVHVMFAETARAAGHVAVVAPGEHAAVLDALRAAGHVPEPRTAHWGAARAYVRTPAGHLVEVMAAPPASTA
jgi:catechol 2,3-dioxygenase-like lactoylglutathione lyase family enzyme